MANSPFARPLVLSVAIAGAVAADQIVKILVEAFLPFHDMVPVIPSLALFRTYNEGIAFSMLSGLSDYGLIALAVAVVGFVLYLWRRTSPDRHFAHPGYALIIGGALGNLIDRAVHGYVIDYVLFHTGNWSFAIFNLADAFISVGAALIVLDEFLAWREQRRARSKDGPSAGS